LRKVLLILVLVALISLTSSEPTGPDVIDSSNMSGSLNSPIEVNLSGGEIGFLNISAEIKNRYWKAFVGQVRNVFTLKDSSGASIYDWEGIFTTGQIYATRNETLVSWENISCANKIDVESENVFLNHTNIHMNITSTFNLSSHREFYVASTLIEEDSCNFTIKTYVNNQSQNESFEEIILSDNSNLIYTSLLEPDTEGFNGEQYDFQMLVPERGEPDWEGITPYYVYIELI